MAEVFLARADGPMGFQKTLVVKRVLPHFAENPLFTAMFLTEAKLAARLDHPNVVQVFDFGEVDGAYYLAMEFIDGPNLRTLIQNAWRRGEPPSYALCAKVCSLACEGLAYAHAFRDPDTSEALNLVHRDISPENIIVSRSGAVKVVDFGIAKVSSGVSLTKSGVIKGKMAYMPPEQLARGNLDKRVDVFALGMVMYEMLTGAMPFDSTSEVTIIQAIMGPEPIPSIAARRPEVPPPLQQIASKALAKRRDDRYEDCRAFQKDLDRFLASTRETVPGHAIADWVRAMEMPIEVRESVAPSKTAVARHLAETDSGIAATHVRPSGGAPADPLRTSPDRPARSRVPVALFAGLVAVLAGLGVWRSGWGGGEAKPLRREVTEPTVVKPPEAAIATAPLPPQPLPKEVAEPIAPEVDAPVKSPPPASEGVRVEFRIRPYAQVFVDGRLLGQTPFPPVRLTAGAHRMQLVNKSLGKDVSLRVMVPSQREFVFRHNLAD